MKIKKDKNFLSMIVFLFLWISPAVPMYLKTKDVVFIVGFMLSTELPVFFNNKWETFCGLAAITLVLAIYNYTYVFNVMPAILLIYAYFYLKKTHEDKKNEEHDISNIYVTLCAMALAAGFIYVFINGRGNDLPEINNLFLKGFLLLYSIPFILLFVSKRKSNTKQLSKTKKRLSKIYILEIIGLTYGLINHFTFNGLDVFPKGRISTCYWVAVLIYICLSKDAVTEELIYEFKKITKRYF